MKKNNIFVLVAILLIIGGLIVIANPGDNSNSENTGYTITASNNSEIIVDGVTNYDFGTISMAKGKVSYTFSVKNAGLSDAEIKRVYTSCMCTLAVLNINDQQFGPFNMQRGADINKSLASGQEAGIEAIFDPAAHGPAGVGNIRRTVTVEIDSGDLIVFNFSANVTP